jgi:tripartite-type tricarboxylate transporter receptor subunit TctC
MKQNGKAVFSCILSLFLIFVMSVGWAKQVQCQEKFPTRAVDLIIPWAPGGTTDLWSRFLADFLKKKWGVQVNPINKTGGGSVPANVEVYQAKPDGYTMLADSQSSTSFLNVGYKDLPFKVLDRTFIATVAAAPIVFMCSPKSPWTNLKDLEAEVKKDPANFSWVSIGAGGSDASARQFFKAIGVDVGKTKPVVTRGMGEGNTLTAGGHIKMCMDATPTAYPNVKGGLLKALAITKYRMEDLYPGLTTAAEQGYPGVDVVWWWGISGPPNLPPHIVAKWDEALREISKDPEYIAKMKNVGSILLYRNANETREHVKKEMEMAADLWGVK